MAYTTLRRRAYSVRVRYLTEATRYVSVYGEPMHTVNGYPLTKAEADILQRRGLLYEKSVGPIYVLCYGPHSAPEYYNQGCPLRDTQENTELDTALIDSVLAQAYACGELTDEETYRPLCPRK